ncbi:MAG: DNA topoisomerase 3 [bacterium]|nr:DNA topoisomerase 3 [bacterium]
MQDSPSRPRPKRSRRKADPAGPAADREAALPGGKLLVVAEKPSMARDFARAMGGFARAAAWESESMVVTWAIGHLVELAEPEDYDPAWKPWRLSTLPILPDSFRLRAVARTKAHLARVVALLQRPDFTAVVNACDAGREGELIFRYLYEVAGCRLPVQRLWVSSLTAEAIRDGFRRLRPGQEFDLLAAAARCRSESDWLVGINATRGMTKVAGTLLSVGRVQTPTLALMVEREKEIASFVVRPFWKVLATFRCDSGEYQGQWFQGEEDRLWSEADARQVASRVERASGRVDGVERTRRAQPPRLLHDLTDLQGEMNRKRGFSAAKTLRLAQALYEDDKLLTYPRTGSRYLTPDLSPSLPRILAVVAGSGLPGAHQAAQVLAGPKLPVSGRIINPGRVKDHHAIIPTPRPPEPGQLAGDKGEVYQAVVRRFVACFLPACVTETTRVETVAGDDRFRSEGQVFLERGWRVLYPGEDGDSELPPLAAGMPVEVAGVALEEGQTRPPARYTDASLLRAMETAGSLVEDEDLAEAMREEGLGTPATRAAIIERLIEVGYVERENRALVPTPKGMELVARLPVRELASVALTGRWEKRLREVEEGRYPRERFMEDIRHFTAGAVEQIRQLDQAALAGKLVTTVGACPRCGAPVAESWRAFGCTAACPFRIARTIAGRKITSRQAAQLLTRGKTALLRGFRSRAGRRFAAYLKLEADGRVTFEFPSRPAARRTKRPARGKG